MKKKILFLLSFKHDASSRFRVEAFYGKLEKDFNITTYYVAEKPKFLPKFLKSPYKKILLLCLAFASRRYDAVLMHRSVSSYKKGLWFEKILQFFNKNIIFDFDDAIYMHNEQKVAGIIAHCKSVICGNDYLKAFASQYNSNCYVVPTCSDTDTFIPKQKKETDTITIGWTGTSSNYQFFSIGLIEQIARILKKYPDVRFLFICDTKPDARFTFEYDFIKWKSKSEVSDIQKLDIGLMPLLESDWAKGKCGFKLIQYGAIGIPSLGSDVGVNAQIIADGINGYIIKDDDWYEKIESLILEKELRKNMGENGRKNIESHYGINANYPKLKKIIEDCIRL
jgi:glycosyltransferase involved in cell wall biosynthesis